MDLAASPAMLAGYAMDSPTLGIAQAARSMAIQSMSRTEIGLPHYNLFDIITCLTHFAYFLDHPNIFYVTGTLPYDLNSIAHNVLAK